MTDVFFETGTRMKFFSTKLCKSINEYIILIITRPF